MKKKVKILITCVFLGLTLCLFGYGVYAATIASFSVTSSVSYTVNNLYIDINASVSGGDLVAPKTFVYSCGENGTYKTDAVVWNNSTEVGEGITANSDISSIAFKPATQGGNKIIYTFTFANKSPSMSISGTITATPNEIPVTRTIKNGNSEVTTLTLQPQGMEGDSVTIVVEYSLTSITHSFSDTVAQIDFNFQKIN